MLNAGRILKAISRSSYESTPESPRELGAVAAFLSWLAYSTDPEDLLTPELLGQFFQECLEYPHWQQHKKLLGNEVRNFLEAICQHQDEIFSFHEVQWPENIQLVDLEHQTDWIDCVSSYLTSQYQAQEKFRLLHDISTQKMIAVVLKSDGGLLVRQFSKKFFIRDGALAPLREDLQLKYNARLELSMDSPQKVETAAFTTARFLVQEKQLFGNIARGYFFQKMHNFNAVEMITLPRLFYTVRRLEQHFIKRESDPFYQYIIDSTEHCVRMLKIGDEEFVQKAPDLLSSAQNALEFVFIGDKLLSLLVRDLQYTMAGHPAVEIAKTTAVKQKEENLWTTNKAQPSNMNTLNNLKSQRPSQPTPRPQAVRPRRPYESDLTN